jgi:hypothetical protein
MHPLTQLLRKIMPHKIQREARHDALAKIKTVLTFDPVLASVVRHRQILLFSIVALSGTNRDFTTPLPYMTSFNINLTAERNQNRTEAIGKQAKHRPRDTGEKCTLMVVLVR